MPNADDLRRHANQYHQFADDTLASCRLMVAWLAGGGAESAPPACDICQRCAEGYRAIALDHTQRAVWQDILKGVVHR